MQPSYTFTENGIVGTIGVERVGRFDEDFNVIVQGGTYVHATITRMF